MQYRYNNFQKAASGFEQFLNIYPDHRLAYNARFIIAEAHFKMRKYDKSLKFFENILIEAGAKRPQVRYYIAENHFALKHFEEAKNILTDLKINHTGTFIGTQAANLLKKIPQGDKNEE